MPHRPRQALVINLLAQMAFGLLAMTLCIPSMQDWPAIFGVPQSQVQLTFSAYVAAYGGAQLVYGPLADRHGRKRVLMAGLMLAALGSALAWLAGSLDTLLLARALQGAGTAAGMVVGRALVQDLFVGRERTRMMAFVGMTMGVCPPLATLIGGQLHVWLGWSSNFALALGLSLGLLLAAWRGLPDVRPAATPQASGWAQASSAYLQLFGQRAFLLYALILATTSATAYTYFAGAPIVLKAFGIGPQSVGWFIMAVPLPYVLGNILTSRLIHRYGDRKLMLWGQIGTLAGLVLMLALALAGVASTWALLIPLAIMGVGHGLLVPPTLSGAVGAVPALAGTAAAISGSLQQMCGALGGYLVGLVDHQGSLQLSMLMLLMALIALLGHVMLARTMVGRH
ncbi:MAG: multidrug effflux MFS transporter [Betaproteobacteria bacterium]